MAEVFMDDLFGPANRLGVIIYSACVVPTFGVKLQVVVSKNLNKDRAEFAMQELTSDWGSWPINGEYKQLSW